MVTPQASAQAVALPTTPWMMMARRRGPRLGQQVTHELLTLARVATLYPLGMIKSALHVGARRDGEHEHPHDTPVILVHGYVHNRSGWIVFERQLREAGFTSVHTISYLRLGEGVPALAERLARRVSEVQAATGAAKVHLVAHSLGGIVARWYIEELGGDAVVDAAITLGSPHGGLRWTVAGLEPTLRDLRPGSSVLTRLDADALPGPVRWFAYCSDTDRVVGCRSAQLLPGALDATNVVIHGQGHLGMLMSTAVARAVTANLEARTWPPPCGDVPDELETRAHAMARTQSLQR
jgi:triacylglycerol lipase